MADQRDPNDEDPAARAEAAAIEDVELIDLAPTREQLTAIALEGLDRTPRSLPPALFYDERGSQLFERICELPEYYLTRTEISILRSHVEAIAAALGPRVQLIEPGSGAGTKTRLLLSALEDPVSYVAIDISREPLLAAAARIEEIFADLEVQAVCADFTRPLEIPAPARRPARRVVFFPGSSIGNFEPADAGRFLARMADLAGPGGGLLIGFDRRKDEHELVAAYDDSQGVTAAFNKNAIARLNRECGADFPLERFRHRARWNAQESCIEIHLVSEDAVEVHLGGRTIPFAAGETIHTESCYKYGPQGVADLTDRFVLRHTWTDDEDRFGVQYLEVAGESA